MPNARFIAPAPKCGSSVATTLQDRSFQIGGRAMLTHINRFHYIVPLMFMAVAVGCEQDKQGATGTVERAPSRANDTPSAARTAPADAVARIAGARCTRAAACDRVGAGKDFADPNVCRATLQDKLREDLGQRECVGGVDPKELDECLEEIRNEDCGNPLDQLGRLVACRTSDLC
jgi:hypothetical protein